MKRTARVVKKRARKDSVVAMALTWDGARWPVRTLQLKARAFLAGDSKDAVSTIPSTREMAKFLADDRVSEIRLCWVPRLKGGDAVLAESFPTPGGKRIGFRAVRTLRLGDVLGVIYRR